MTSLSYGIYLPYAFVYISAGLPYGIKNALLIPTKAYWNK